MTQILFLLTLLMVTTTTKSEPNPTYYSNSTTILIRGRNQTIQSEKHNFELGFFNLNNNKLNWYLGIWYTSITTPTYVWVANRNNPIKNINSLTLELTPSGRLALKESQNVTVWHSSNLDFSTKTMLLDNGNLVLLTPEGTVSWQSFDYPTDTWLPGMNLTKDRFLTSWRTVSDPSLGFYTLRLKPPHYGEFELVYNGTKGYWSTGNWTGEIFSNVPEMTLPYIYNFQLENAYKPTASFRYAVKPLEKGSVPPLTRFKIDYSGRLEQYTWSPQAQNWNKFWLQPENVCLVYGFCGSFSVCSDGNLQHCECLSGFRPVEDEDYSKGCSRESLCNENDGFEKVGFVDFEGANHFQMVQTTNLEGAKRRESEEEEEIGSIWRRRKKRDLNVVVFSYKELHEVTKGFSQRLGHGGFGTVFQGELLDSTLVAVKRLERPGHGQKEFLAEVCTIGKIQHVNVVRLRGFCSEQSHRLLVYDYMSNGPLSYYLKQEGSPSLSWDIRFRIAVGTARGIAYLHEECRDCIIHCDIKPENILLDSDFTAKVSDFGLAKLIGREFSRVSATTRGTRGYVAPEWISGLAITTKADVYSFGMTLLELIRGRRNVEAPTSSGVKEEKLFFPPWAAQHIIEGNVVAVVDDRLGNAYDIKEVERVACVAIWCIQDDESMRPTMGKVVKMLEGLVEVTAPPPPRLLQALVSGESFHGLRTDSSNGENITGGCFYADIMGVCSGSESPLGNVYTKIGEVN
uniref:Receptor-like serine/threonine-protein kinase n=1 Tax=Fagus sylvatica TaxID=28930 RepID=A0A2N9IXZ0_FAGSY